jgi:uncharacterized membrane protein
VGAVIVIAMRSIIDIPTALIALTTVLVLVYIKKIQEPQIILVAAIIGLLLNWLFGLSENILAIYFALTIVSGKNRFVWYKPLNMSVFLLK